MPFFILFVIVPIMELMVFAAVGDEVGLLNALLLALLTAIIGGAVVRHQGLQTLSAVQTAMRNGKMPAGELFDGLCLIAAGATLITPGFITDTIGFLLLVPAFRSIIKHYIKNHTNMAFDVHPASGFQQSTPHDPDIIEVEYEEVDERTRDN